MAFVAKTIAFFEKTINGFLPKIAFLSKNVENGIFNSETSKNNFLNSFKGEGVQSIIENVLKFFKNDLSRGNFG